MSVQHFSIRDWFKYFMQDRVTLNAPCTRKGLYHIQKFDWALFRCNWSKGPIKPIFSDPERVTRLRANISSFRSRKSRTQSQSICWQFRAATRIRYTYIFTLTLVLFKAPHLMLLHFKDLFFAYLKLNGALTDHASIPPPTSNTKAHADQTTSSLRLTTVVPLLRGAVVAPRRRGRRFPRDHLGRPAPPHRRLTSRASPSPSHILASDDDTLESTAVLLAIDWVGRRSISLGLWLFGLIRRKWGRGWLNG